MTQINDKLSFWWKSDKDTVHQTVLAYIEGIQREQSLIREKNKYHAKLYAGSDILTPGRKDAFDFRPRVNENIIQSVCDTATALIAKNRPRAVFMTDNADFSLQRKAKNLGKYMEGVFTQVDYYNQSVKMFRDAVIFGTGCIKFWGKHNRVWGERVLIDEIVVDEAECFSSEKPRQMHQVKFVDAHVLSSAFPQFKEEIFKARGMRKHDWGGHNNLDSNQVVVSESWRLPSEPGAKDGRHIIAVESASLFDEPWKNDWFPFVFYRWNTMPTGFYGQGLVEQLAGLQLEINRLNKFINISQRLLAAPRVFVDVGSKINKAHMERNDIGQIIPFRGRPPIFQTPQAVGGEIYAYKEQLKRSAFEIAGISQLSAQAKKPGGLESAVALRELTNRESDRFAIQEIGFEETALDAARVIIKISKDLYKNGSEAKSTFREKNFIRTIPWKKVDMDDDRFQMSVQASSIVSRTPAGRFQQVVELGQAGFIQDPDIALSLLDHPDVSKQTSRKTASIASIEEAVERMLDGEPLDPPDPMQDLNEGIEVVRDAYLEAKKAGAEDDILQTLRDWVQMAQQILDQAEQGRQQAALEQQMLQQQALQAAQPAQPAQLDQLPPPGVPEEQAVSDDIPPELLDEVQPT